MIDPIGQHDSDMLMDQYSRFALWKSRFFKARFESVKQSPLESQSDCKI